MIPMPDDNSSDLSPMAKIVSKMKEDHLAHHNQMLDYYRSIDDIVKEGSNPSSEGRFTSSSGRTPDDGSSPLGGKAK